MGGGVAGASKQRTSRSDGPILDVDAEFPPMRSYEPRTKLPSIRSVVGMVKYHTGKGGAGNSTDMAVREVAKQIYAKWYHDTVACKSITTIIREVEKHRSTFVEGKKKYSLGENYHHHAIVKKFLELVSMQGMLFDV